MSDFTINNPKPQRLIIRDQHGDDLVVISMEDGSMTFGAHYQPDVAARQFWKAVSDEYRVFLAWKESRR